MSLIPLSLYIHLPWCLRKCPYCDFNSYAIQKNELPEELYIQALIKDLESSLPLIWGRRIISIFIGGGTPSLFSAKGLEKILEAIRARLAILPNAEITLEVNPGTQEYTCFKTYQSIGINRVSLGAQSFQDKKLVALGRVHHSKDTLQAVEKLHAANFSNFNIDIMHGLPEQTVDDALFDLGSALNLEPAHLSWYELTLEPNTVFYHQKPVLPADPTLEAIVQEGKKMIASKGFSQYEVSAYAKLGMQSVHNVNYWEFGDYLGIGAGAHSKITDVSTATILRLSKTRYPKSYMNPEQSIVATEQTIESKDRPFEFMLNALRLIAGFNANLFEERTFLPLSVIQPELNAAVSKKLLTLEQKNTQTWVKPTTLGNRFLNDLMALFMKT